MKKAALILSVVLLMASLPFSASAAYYNGFIYSETQEGTVAIEALDYSIASGDIVVPEEIDGKKVTFIGKDAFSYKQFITSVTLPATVTEIAEEAFYMCVGLKKVVIPDGVSVIGERCFALCEALEEITIPCSVQQLGGEMFADCKGLKTAYIYSTDGKIGADFFRGCDSLESIYISKGIKTFFSSAIDECPALADIYCQGSEADISFGGKKLEKPGVTVHYEYDYEGFPKTAEQAAEKENGKDPVNPLPFILVAAVVLILIGAAVVTVKRKRKKAE